MFTPDAHADRERWGLSEARIVLGVTGGIAAYKAADLASALVQAGATVDVVMTAGAQKFVQPLTFEGLTHRRVYSGVFEGWENEGAGHVGLAAAADLLLIAPATANTIARLAQGLVDDMLTAIALSTSASILIAPAMEHHMWHHPATQANVALLRERGVRFAGPSAGRLASGAIGMGRLAPIPDIIWASRASVGARGPLAGKTVVVTAGGTREEIDPVRFIGNGSSGRMGVALVGAALDRGAAVRLIATESVEKSLLPPDSIIVESALELQTAVNEQVETADVLIMTAAVADFRPAMRSDQKVKKQAGQEAWAIDLVRNPDIVAGISRAGLLKVGFAAETENLVENAREKLVAKGLDAIVVNEAVATIGSSRSAATIISVGQEAIVLPELGKDVVADRVMDEVVRLLMVSDA